MRISDWSSDVCSSDLNSRFYGNSINIPAVRAWHIKVNDFLIRSHTWNLEAVNRRFSMDYFGISALHRSEEHTSELQSLMRISYAVFCLKKKTHTTSKETILYSKIILIN